MSELTIQLPADWPTEQMLRELFKTFQPHQRVTISTANGEMVAVTCGVSGDIGLSVVRADGIQADATFTTAGGGGVRRLTNLALLILMHAMAMDKEEPKEDQEE